MQLRKISFPWPAFFAALALASLVLLCKLNKLTYVYWDDGEHWLETFRLLHKYQAGGLAELFTFAYWELAGRPIIQPLLGLPFLILAHYQIQAATAYFCFTFVFLFQFSLAIAVKKILRTWAPALVICFFVGTLPLPFPSYLNFMPELPFLAFLSLSLCFWVYQTPFSVGVSGVFFSLAGCQRPAETMFFLLINLILAAATLEVPPLLFRFAKHLLVLLISLIALLAYARYGISFYQSSEQTFFHSLQIFLPFSFLLVFVMVRSNPLYRFFFVSLYLPLFWFPQRSWALFAWVESGVGPREYHWGKFFARFTDHGQLNDFLWGMLRAASPTFFLFFLLSLFHLARKEGKEISSIVLFAILQFFTPLAIIYLSNGLSRNSFERFILVNTLVFYGIAIGLLWTKGNNWNRALTLAVCALQGFFLLNVTVPITDKKIVALEQDAARTRQKEWISQKLEQAVFAKIEKIIPPIGSKVHIACAIEPKPGCPLVNNLLLLAYEKNMLWEISFFPNNHLKEVLGAASFGPNQWDVIHTRYNFVLLGPLPEQATNRRFNPIAFLAYGKKNGWIKNQWSFSAQITNPLENFSQNYILVELE